MFNQRNIRIIIITIAMLLSLVVVSAQISLAREITDMTGQKVTIPDSINKVFAPSPYASYIMYTIDPAMLISINLSHNVDKRYLPRAVQDLPVIGALTGQNQQANLEMVLKAKPDIAIMWSTKRSAVQGKVDEALKQLNLPLVYAVAESLNDYPDIYLFLGKILNREERTKRLSAYCQKTLSEVKNIVDRIPKAKRPTVYYAEGVDGLRTECNDSMHAELLQLAGDTDVHRCHTASHQGMEKISLEQITLYNPDVIIAQERVFYDKVYKDPAWQNIRAVRDKKVYLIPHIPLNWFDRPPSFMRILGLKWLVNILYREEYNIDIVKEARDFCRLFLDVELSEDEVKHLIYPGK